MYRMLAKVLILFILFANLAWAADMDEVGISYDSANVQASVGALGDPSDDGGAGHDGVKNGVCDHCCHGSAHYVGVPHQTSLDFADDASCAPALRVTTRYSRDQEPPLPPPNI